MSATSTRFLLIFLDGVGLGEIGEENPLSVVRAMPALADYIEQPLIAGATLTRQNALLKGIDATLGIPGLPQSATGQTTIYTGQNAPAFLGRHQSGFANGSLRQLIDEFGLFKRAIALGHTATLANAYSPEYFYAIANRKRRYSVCTLLNMTANLPFRMQYEYDQGEAVFWDITGEFSRSGKRCCRSISPKAAGKRLAELSGRYGITLFESYLSDFAGHAQDKDRAISCLQRIDVFLESAIAHLPPDVTLIITSDHGNIEDLSTKRHTLNKVPLIVVGSWAVAFSRARDLTDITPQILELLDSNFQTTSRSH